MQKYEFSYDRENDDLVIFRTNARSKGSVELGDMILDYNSKKELVGIQIMNATKFFDDIIKEDNISVKKILNDLSECELDITAKNNMLIIKIILISKSDKIEPVLTIPSITVSSPALAYA